jgi:hypothetical protein
VAILTFGCSGDGRGQASFCSKLRDEHAQLLAPVSDARGVTTMVNRYKGLDRIAPEAIREQWHELTVLFEQAATVDPAKKAEAATLSARAFASSSSARAVVGYAKTTCGVTLAPTATAATRRAPPTTR